MRCFSCRSWSFQPICRHCLEASFVPKVQRRQVGTLDVYSFFPYEQIEPLLLTKHKPEGWRIYRFLAKRFVRPFLQTFAQGLSSDVHILGIDERPKGGYAHVAVLTHALRGIDHLSVRHGMLRATHHVSYAGQSLAYRLAHPRGFTYRGEGGIEAIIIDDIVTTGTTLQEAYMTLQIHDVNVLFALTLADANRT